MVELPNRHCQSLIKFRILYMACKGWLISILQPLSPQTQHYKPISIQSTLQPHQSVQTRHSATANTRHSAFKRREFHSVRFSERADTLEETCLDAFLNAKKVTSSIQGSIAIYPIWHHNHFSTSSQKCTLLLPHPRPMYSG